MSTTRSWWAIALLAALILLITMGIRMSLGLFVQPWAGDTPLSIAEISLALAVCQLMWGVAQPVTGAAADRWGALPVVLAGAVVLALGAVLLPLMPTFWGLMLTVGVMLAVGSGAASHSVLMSVVANQVPAHVRGSASGVVNAGGSFGQFLFAPVLQGLIFLPSAGWQGAMYALAMVSLLIMPLVWLLTRGQFKPTPNVQTAKPTAHATEQTLSQAAKQAMSDKSYWLIHAAFFTCGFHIAFLVSHLPTEVALCGLPPSVASWSLAIIGLSNVAGCLFIGWCVGHTRSKYLLFWMYGSRAALIVAYLLMPRTDWTFYLFAIGLGFTWLATVPPTAALVGKLFGTRYLATLFGLTLLSHQVGGFFGAWLGGWAISAFGDYGWMWYADMALAAAAALLNLPIREVKIARQA
ncbi:MAG: MFS transporter [Neisseria sp.]|nr:MFS transporter [Neisseria sp.]